MVSLRTLVTALAGAALFVQSSIAHSTKRNHLDYVSTIQDAVIKSPTHRVTANSHFDLTFTIDDGQTPVRLSLEPNHDILHHEFSVTTLGADGRVKDVENVPRNTHRVYRGRTSIQRPDHGGWADAGWARITVHRDGAQPVFDGAFKIYGDTHHVRTVAQYQRERHPNDPSLAAADPDAMAVYRDRDISRPDAVAMELRRRYVEPEISCDADTLDFNSRFDASFKKNKAARSQSSSLGSMNIRSLFGRQMDDVDGGAGTNHIPDIGSTAGCPTTRKVALVGIATDCNYFEEFNEDAQAVRKNIISIVNQASALYEDTFKISLGIRNITSVEQTCAESGSEQTPWNVQCSDDVDLSDRLNLFSAWRGDNPDTNAYWTLLTTCNTGSAVGLAWRGQLCRTGSSNAQDSSGANETVAAANVVVHTSSEWQVFAHETGHTFGAVHDCTSSTCPVSTDAQSCCPLSSSTCNAGGRFIMNPSTGDGIDDFSPCSIGNICSGLSASVDDDCLSDNQNVGTITGKQCGNGIVEEGEDCDCGGSDGCDDNSCCNPDTCTFKDGAECDPTNEACCTDTCKFASSSTVCRASNGECDPEEKCSGSSGDCPDDEHRDDGSSCGDGDGLKCASGKCTSRDAQCRSSLGNSTSIRSCGSTDMCVLACTDPDSGSDQCTLNSQNLIDGTPCSGDGRCENGTCTGSSTWGRVKEWFRDNKRIAIPVGAVLAGLLTLSIVSCIWSRCRRASAVRAARRRAKEDAAIRSDMSGPPSAEPVYMTGGSVAGEIPRPPPPSQQPPPMQQQQAGYYEYPNGQGYSEPPEYGFSQQQWGQQAWGRNGPRYA